MPTEEALELGLAAGVVGMGAAIAEQYGMSAAIKIAVRGAIATGVKAAEACEEGELGGEMAMSTL